MKHSNIITFALVSAISGIAFADTLLVPTEYGSIQSGIDAAVEGDIVQVDAGIYYETIDFLGKAITLISTDGDPSGTTIDAGVAIGPVMSFITNETSESVLDGFTLRNGDAVDGGGVYIVGSSPTIQNCIISGNTASRFGAGIYLESGTLTLENVAIIGNASVKTGAGIYMMFSDGSITGGSFENNSGTSGVAIYYKDGTGDLMLTDVLMKENLGSKHGGAIYNKSSSLIVQGCNFEMNVAGEDGGAFYSYNGGDSTFSNCQFLNNTAIDDGGVAYFRNSTASFTTCTFDANIADSDCDGSGGSGVMELYSSSVTLENPTICVNLICDTIEDFSGGQPTIIGDILGCSSGVGACCGGTACWEMSYSDCLDGGGVWGGEDTICEMVNCYSADAGGCCIDDQCIMAVTEDACLEAFGEFQGILIECADTECIGCPADLNGDGSVEVNDIIEVISSWGACP